MRSRSTIVSSRPPSMCAAQWTRRATMQRLRFTSVFALGGATVTAHDAYSGWPPNPDSPLLALMTQTYQDLFGVAPAAVAVHAGLETSVAGVTYPGLDMISIGPTILDVHSPDERWEVASTAPKVYELLVAAFGCHSVELPLETGPNVLHEWFWRCRAPPKPQKTYFFLAALRARKKRRRSMNRVLSVDLFRGFALICMVVIHFMIYGATQRPCTPGCTSRSTTSWGTGAPPASS